MNARGTSGLTCDRDAIRVASERGYVVMDPPKCRDLIEQSIITARMLFGLSA
jgi:hypothetical protein